MSIVILISYVYVLCHNFYKKLKQKSPLPKWIPSSSPYTTNEITKFFNMYDVYYIGLNKVFPKLRQSYIRHWHWKLIRLCQVDHQPGDYDFRRYPN